MECIGVRIKSNVIAAIIPHPSMAHLRCTGINSDDYSLVRLFGVGAPLALLSALPRFARCLSELEYKIYHEDITKLTMREQK